MHLGETHDVTKQHSSLDQPNQLDPQEKLFCVRYLCSCLQRLTLVQLPAERKLPCAKLV